MSVWLFIGPIVGGGMGWLLGRYNSRVARRDCATTTVPS
jgi:hypothetical protein